MHNHWKKSELRSERRDRSTQEGKQHKLPVLEKDCKCLLYSARDHLRQRQSQIHRKSLLDIDH